MCILYLQHIISLFVYLFIKAYINLDELATFQVLNSYMSVVATYWMAQLWRLDLSQVPALAV